MSTSSKPHLTTEELQKTRAKFRQFRILVIGRANAGKTTILRKVCNTTGDPVIFDPEGNKIESSTLDPSVKRGQHDIGNQMVFEGNPGFVFHDSRGFEAGGDRELRLVQRFIEQRSKANKVEKQLHAIWYCIPTTDDRPITAAERKFFNECGTGLVPVIVLWTKTDYLDLDKIMELIRKGSSRSDAMEQAPEKAWVDFEKNIIPRFREFKYPPKGYVAFRKMHEPGGDCTELIEKTADALSGEQLQEFFLSTQQINVDLCLKYGVRAMMEQTQLNGLQFFQKYKGNWACFMVMVLRYFPYLFFVSLDNLDVRKRKKKDKKDVRRVVVTEEEEWMVVVDVEEEVVMEEEWEKWQESHDIHSIFDAMSFFLSGLSTQFNLKEATYCAIVAAIIGHLVFCLKKDSSPTLEQAVQIYRQSTSDLSVKQAVEHLFEGHPVTPAINRRFLNPFKPQAPYVDDMLAEEAIQIALNNRLSMK